MRQLVVGGLMVVSVMNSNFAIAANATGNYAIWGIGQASCNQFAQAFDADSVKDYQTYLAGYFTAYSTFANAAGAPDPSLKDALRKIHDHCATHRMDSFERGIQFILQSPTRADTRKGTGPAPAWGRPPVPARP